MRVTEILIQEHKIILDVLSKVDALFANARYGANTNLIQTYIIFFQKYADEFHHSKEEKIYFSWLKDKNPELEHGQIMCMESEHEQGRILLRNAKSCVDKFSTSNDANDLIEMKKNLIAFSQLLKNHISKEDEVVYQMAEEINKSTSDGDNLMLEKFIAIENKNMDLISHFKYLGA